MSLLSWERGLKYLYKLNKDHIFQSLLSWERGLKSVANVMPRPPVIVAPLVGAWIEIL